MGMEWQKLLLAAGGAAAAGLALYYLLREEADDSRSLPSMEVDGAELQKCIDILREMNKSSQHNKKVAEKLARDWAENPLSFEELMKRVSSDMKQDDALQKRGLHMSDIEKMLEKHQSNEEVRNLVLQFMGATNTPPSAKAGQVSVETIKDIHRLMVTELDKFFKDFQARPDAGKYDATRVLTASQVVLNGKVHTKFGLTAEDVEGAIHLKHEKLQTDQEFLNLTQQMQHLLMQSGVAA